jgi:hypothetical protein
VLHRSVPLFEVLVLMLVLLQRQCAGTGVDMLESSAM